MKKRTRSRAFRPALRSLETRRLLSLVTVTSDGQDGTNLVGIDASPGPGAFVNLHLALSGLQSANVSAIRVHKDGGFDWQFGPNPNAFANAEFFQNGTTGDLYISPEIDSDAGLTSSTGAPIALKTGDTLDVSIY